MEQIKENAKIVDWEKKILSEFVIIVYNIGNFYRESFLNKKFLMKYWENALKMFLERKF